MSIGFSPVPYPNVDAFLFRPVIEGMWQQKEAFNGTYTFHDLLDAHELLDVRDANKVVADEWRKRNG